MFTFCIVPNRNIILKKPTEAALLVPKNLWELSISSISSIWVQITVIISPCKQNTLALMFHLLSPARHDITLWGTSKLIYETTTKVKQKCLLMMLFAQIKIVDRSELHTHCLTNSVDKKPRCKFYKPVTNDST